MNNLVESAPSCANPDCDVRNTGACVEGHLPVESCPLVTDPDVNLDLEDDSEIADLESDISMVNVLTVESGRALTEEELARFLRWRAAKRIAIIGDLSSGKSTLLSALYSSFVRGPYGGMSFVGSHTLVAFEQLIHHSREASGGNTPDTRRTSINDGIAYYHIALAPTGSPDRRVDLLLSDRAGEVYHRVRDNPADAEPLTELLAVDRVVLLLDGNRLTKLDAWANAIQGVRQLIRGLLDGRAINQDTVIQVVITKCDLIDASTDKDAIYARIDRFQKSISTAFLSRLGGLVFSNVAARPENMAIPAAGLDELLLGWINSARVVNAFELGYATLRSEFDKFSVRTPIERG